MTRTSEEFYPKNFLEVLRGKQKAMYTADIPIFHMVFKEI